MALYTKRKYDHVFNDRDQYVLTSYVSDCVIVGLGAKARHHIPPSKGSLQLFLRCAFFTTPWLIMLGLVRLGPSPIADTATVVKRGVEVSTVRYAPER
jgi:hypothetical protein